MAKKKLGRGLESLIGSADTLMGDAEEKKDSVKKTEKLTKSDNISADDNKNTITLMKLTRIEPNKKQPRKTFDKEKILALGESIKENGLIQPIIVSKAANDMYKIVAGERRWRAAKAAGLKEIPVLIREYSDEEIAEVALVENLQRENLNPVEEALGYNLLMEEFSLTQDAVSKKVGKSRSAVANSLRLLTLNTDAKNALIDGSITSGHARAILSVEDTLLQSAMLKRIIDDGLSVRQAEALSKQITKKAPQKKPSLSAAQLSAIDEMENKLSSSFGTKVKITSNGKKGKIEIEYFGNDDFERIVKMFKI